MAIIKPVFPGSPSEELDDFVTTGFYCIYAIAGGNVPVFVLQR